MNQLEWLAALRRDGIKWELWSTWDGRVCFRMHRGWKEAWEPFCVEEDSEEKAIATARARWLKEWKPTVVAR